MRNEARRNRSEPVEHIRTPEEELQRARNYLVWLMARQEYSQMQLRRKLGERPLSAEQIEQLLEELIDYGYQSDHRFASSFIRTRISRGQGKRRIEQELLQRGVKGEVMGRAFDEVECDWFELALDVFQRKFRQPASDHKEKQKQWRFMMSRGFDAEQIRYAIEAAAEVEQ